MTQHGPLGRRLIFNAGGFPHIPSTIVQTAVGRGVSSLNFGVNTTIGNLLLYMATRRQGTALPPDDGGTWTTLQSGQFQRTSTSDENGILACARIADAATTFYRTDGASSVTNGVMWEIANATLAGITSLLVSDHAAATALDIGSLGSPGSSQLAFLLAGNGADLTAETVTPGVWIRDLFADRDNDSGGSNSLPGSGGFPQSWYGHTPGAGVALQARIDISSAQKYGGIAVLLP